MSEAFRHPQAACQGMPLGVFFFDDLYVWPHVRPAYAACGRCEVRAECLRFALAHPDLDGIWGGTTPEDRRRMRSGELEDWDEEFAEEPVSVGVGDVPLGHRSDGSGGTHE